MSRADLPPEVLERVEVVIDFVRMVSSLWVPRTIYVAAELGVADLLADGPLRSDALAREVKADPGALERLLRALVTLGLLTQREDGAFELAPMGALLRSDARDSLRDMVLLQGRPDSLRAWGQLEECVRTGHTAAKLLEGIDDPFEFFAKRPELREIFDRSMAEGTKQLAGAIALAYDFSGIRSIVDVGGGHGALFPPILRAHPDMTGIVFDQPHCREGATRVFEKTRIADRCEFVGGSFFEDALPTGADAYVLKAIIHDWDDARSLAILRGCRASMRDDSRLLVIEVVVPDRLERSPRHQEIASTDLNMLVSTGGRERTEAEYRTLLEAADLRLERVVPTLTLISVIEAVPV